MKFTPDFLKKIFDIIKLNHVIFTVQTVGSNLLSFEDISILKRFGIDLNKIKKDFPELAKSFYWGRLSQALKNQAGNIENNDFLEYLKRGQYIPLNDREKAVLSHLETKTYSHIKGLEDRVKQTVSNIIIDNDPNIRENYEKIIGSSIKRAVIERDSVYSIVSEIGHKTGDWERDLGRIAETELNNAFQHGRAEQIIRENGDNPLVFKNVYDLACRHCINAYLTNGIGSQPKLFRLSELMVNLNNIGKKVKDWKPTLESMHPFCRCTLQHLPKGYVWNQEKQRFDPPKEERNKYGEEGTIKIYVGNKVFTV
jgi:hypothetical protein